MVSMEWVGTELRFLMHILCLVSDAPFSAQCFHLVDVVRIGTVLWGLGYVFPVIDAKATAKA